jgi:hypothetical protein
MTTIKTPHVGKFNNPVTGGILLLIIGLLICGILLTWKGGVILALKHDPRYFLGGLALIAVGMALWIGGEKTHKPANPKEVGMILLWDSPVTFHLEWLPFTEKWSEYILVSGRVILAPYLPIFLDTLVIDIENKEKTFEVEVISKDRITFKAKISMTARPNIHDLLDYMQAGSSMDKVWAQVGPIAQKRTEDACKLQDALDIFFGQSTISKTLEQQVVELFETGSFGTEVVKVQFTPEIPEDVRKKLQAIKFEDWEREAEFKDYGTMQDAARKWQRDLVRQFAINNQRTSFPDENDEVAWAALVNEMVATDQVPNLEYCLESIKTQRLIKEGKVNRLEVPGVNSVNVHAVNFAGGGGHGGGKGGGGKGKGGKNQTP